MLSSASVTTARQPAALPILGLAEIGDRFGYYALISVFVLYLTDIHRIDESHAFLIFGVFMSLASLATLAGGFAADHLFGFGRSIIFGAVLLIAGFAALAVAGADETLFAALALIAVGNGLTTANMPALLGQFYDDQDQHRAAGFTYLYMAINVGAFLGMIAMGLVAARYGYGAAFAMVAGVKLLGLAVYLAGRPWLRAHDGPPAATPTRRWQSLGLLALLLIAVATAVLLAHPADTSGILLLVAGIALGACLVALARGDRDVRSRLAVLLILVVAAVVFWAIYRQFAASVLVFTQIDVNRTLLDWKVPASDLSALNPAFVLVVGPLAAWLWPWLARRRIKVDDYRKFALGLIFTGLSFALLSLGVFTTTAGAPTILLWIALFQLILATGEICLSPVGLALTSKLAPPGLAGSAMGIWYLSTAFAFYLSGVIAQPLATQDGTPAPEGVYGLGFAAYGAAGLATGVIFALLIPRLRRLAPD